MNSALYEYRNILVKISKLPLCEPEMLLRSNISDNIALNTNYSILQTTIYAFSDKFNTKSWLNRYDTMIPLFFKITHGPY